MKYLIGSDEEFTFYGHIISVFVKYHNIYRYKKARQIEQDSGTILKMENTHTDRYTDRYTHNIHPDIF